MPLFRKKPSPLTRAQSLAAYPVVNQLVRYEETDDGNLLLHLPRRMTPMARMITRLLRVPSFRRVELDDLGSFTVRLCDGTHTVKEIIDLFSEKYKLGRREAEVSMIQYLRTLAQRGIVGLAVPTDAPESKPAGPAVAGPARGADGRRGGKWKKRKGRRSRR